MIKSNNFSVAIVPEGSFVPLEDKDKVFTVPAGKVYSLRVFNHGDVRGVIKVFVNNELVTPHGALVESNNFLDINNKKFVGGAEQTFRLEVHDEVKPVGGINIDIHVPIWGPWWYHHHHHYWRDEAAQQQPQAKSMIVQYAEEKTVLKFKVAVA